MLVNQSDWFFFVLPVFSPPPFYLCIVILLYNCMFIMFSLCAWQHAQVARRRGQVQHLQPEERAAVGRGGGRHQARPRLLRGKAEGKYGVRPRLLRGESQRGKGAGVEGLKKTHKLKINKSEPMMIKLTTPPLSHP